MDARFNQIIQSINSFDLPLLSVGVVAWIEDFC